MFRIITYAGYTALNLFVILNLPIVQAKTFLTIYSISSFVSGVVCICLFSNSYESRLIKYRNRWKVFLLSLLAFSVSLYLFQSLDDWKLYSLYAFGIIFTDYLTSQSNIEKLGEYYRAFSITFFAPLLAINFDFHDFLIVRTCVTILIACIAISVTFRFRLLGVNNTRNYILGTNVSYYLPLFVLASTLEGAVLKYWYVVAQVCGGFELRLIDLTIRYQKTKLVEFLMKYSVVLVFFIGIFASNIFLLSWVGTLCLVMMAIGLYITKRKTLRT